MTLLLQLNLGFAWGQPAIVTAPAVIQMVSEEVQTPTISNEAAVD